MKRLYIYVLIVGSCLLQACSYDYIYPEISTYSYWINFSSNLVWSEMQSLDREVYGTDYYIEEINDEGEVIAKKENCHNEKEWLKTSNGAHKLLPVIDVSDRNGLVFSIRFDTLNIEDIFLQHVYLNSSSKQTIVFLDPNIIRVKNVALNESSITLSVGKTSTLVATISPKDANNKEVSWISSNNNIASVSKDGVVTARSVGVATISCITQDGGFQSSCQVNVIAPITYKYWLDFSCSEMYEKLEEYGYSISGADYYITEKDRNGNTIKTFTKPKSSNYQWIMSAENAYYVEGSIDVFGWPIEKGYVNHNKDTKVFTIKFDPLVLQNIENQKINLTSSDHHTYQYYVNPQPKDEEDIVISVSIPTSWSNHSSVVSIWTWEDNKEGTMHTMTWNASKKMWQYTVSNTDNINCVVLSGNTWSSNQFQTQDITHITESICFKILESTGSSKCNIQLSDCI